MHNGQVDVNTSLQLLASTQSSLSDINNADQRADHVIRLTATVFRLCEIEKIAIKANAAHILSPELSSTIMWFLHRWSLNYLMPSESYYSEISMTLLLAFGEESPGALWTLNFLLEKIEYNIDAFKGEQTLITETMNLLKTLVKSQTK